jgi:hypothetical protein
MKNVKRLSSGCSWRGRAIGVVDAHRLMTNPGSALAAGRTLPPLGEILLLVA